LVGAAVWWGLLSRSTKGLKSATPGGMCRWGLVSSSPSLTNHLKMTSCFQKLAFILYVQKLAKNTHDVLTVIWNSKFCCNQGTVDSLKSVKTAQKKVGIRVFLLDGVYFFNIFVHNPSLHYRWIIVLLKKGEFRNVSLIF